LTQKCETVSAWHSDNDCRCFGLFMLSIEVCCLT
jgi:hypothetical protein